MFLEVPLRYQICPEVLPWKARIPEARARASRRARPVAARVTLSGSATTTRSSSSSRTIARASTSSSSEPSPTTTPFTCSWIGASPNGGGGLGPRGPTGARAQATPHVTHAPADFQEELESAASSLDIDALIRAVAIRHGVSVDLIAAIIEAESEFNPRAVSRTGARGLMQLMPKTAAILGVSDPFDPRENIEAGVRHLRSLMDRFDGNLPLVLAAYNAGERAVIGHRGVPPYRETRQYVKRILRRLDRDNAKTSDAGQRERKI